MYVAKHFELNAEQWGSLLQNAQTAQIVAAYETGPEATLLPVEYVADPDGGLGSLVTHVNVINPLWKKPALGEVLAIISGPDSYIEPEWFPSHADDPNVPTWNYVTVHAYGDMIVHQDDAWNRASVSALSSMHGYNVDQVDEEAMQMMLRSIVGIELKLTRVVAKAKLHQNKSALFVTSIADGLDARNRGEDAALADAMRDIALPHAQARDALVAEIRAEYLRSKQ